MGTFCLSFQKVAVNNIVEGTSILIEQVKENLKQKVIGCMKEKTDELSSESVEQIFYTFEDPFFKLKTSHLQSSYVEKKYELCSTNPVCACDKDFIQVQRSVSRTTLVYIAILDSFLNQGSSIS